MSTTYFLSEAQWFDDNFTPKLDDTESTDISELVNDRNKVDITMVSEATNKKEGIAKRP